MTFDIALIVLQGLWLCVALPYHSVITKPRSSPEKGESKRAGQRSVKMSQPIIDVQNLTAAYGSVIALTGVNLSVEKGEIFGLLGPNGAGKTTLLATVEGLHKPKMATFTLVELTSRLTQPRRNASWESNCKRPP